MCYSDKPEQMLMPGADIRNTIYMHLYMGVGVGGWIGGGSENITCLFLFVD